VADDGLWANPIEAILLDLDGTLVVTDDRWTRALAQRLAPLRRLFPKLDTRLLGRRLLTVVETPMNYFLSMLEHLGLGSGFFGLADRLRRSKGLATQGGPALIEGTQPLLRALSRRYKLAVVTTRGRAEAQAFIKQTDLQGFFSVVITRRDVLLMKPHPGPVRKAAEKLGVAPNRCLLVGDTDADIRSARRAGAYAVGVLSGVAVQGELERAGAHLILLRAYDLLNHLPAPTASPVAPPR